MLGESTITVDLVDPTKTPSVFSARIVGPKHADDAFIDFLRTPATQSQTLAGAGLTVTVQGWVDPIQKGSKGDAKQRIWVTGIGGKLSAKSEVPDNYQQVNHEEILNQISALRFANLPKLW
jgi:hypothetical protein